MEQDVLGDALLDFQRGKHEHKLMLHTSYGDVEEMPVDEFFRQPDDFPELEDIALALCDGKVLDIGAGAGSHALYLQSRDMEVHALEISPKACEVMQTRGVQRVVNGDIFEYRDHTYDTLLFLMNGIGIAGNLERLRILLKHCKGLLNPNGQLLFDSSDIAYLYQDGSVPRPKGYFGEIRYQYAYKGILGVPFNWLFIDQETLIRIAHAEGWVVQVLYEDEHDQYLVRMVPLA